MTAALFPAPPPRGRLQVRAAPAAHFAWLEANTGCVLTPRARAVEAVDKHGAVLGMVAFDGWTQNAAQAHMAVVAPLVWRSLLPEALRYVFAQAGRRVVLGTIIGDNRRSLAFVRRLGGREVARVEEGHSPGVDLVLVELRREACHWPGGMRRHGNE